jgi:uncharacterized membrane protein
MLPQPLHPAVVHFPVVLAFLLPLFALGALWVIHRGTRFRAAWSVPLALALALAGSAWLAVQTGEGEAERVERVISEQPLETHEEMAEKFLTASVVLAVVAAGGLIGGIAGKTARVLTAAGAIILVIGAARVGHTGGELVYEHGAASAYTGPNGGRVTTTEAAGTVERDHRVDDDDEH